MSLAELEVQACPEAVRLAARVLQADIAVDRVLGPVRGCPERGSTSRTGPAGLSASVWPRALARSMAACARRHWTACSVLAASACWPRGRLPVTCAVKPGDGHGTILVRGCDRPLVPVANPCLAVVRRRSFWRVVTRSPTPAVAFADPAVRLVGVDGIGGAGPQLDARRLLPSVVEGDGASSPQNPSLWTRWSKRSRRCATCPTARSHRAGGPRSALPGPRADRPLPASWHL